MRTSERVAIAALTVMVAPAFLAFSALGVWWVIHAWPGLTTTQRIWFWLSLAPLGCTVPYVVRRHLDALWYGRTRKLSWFEEALILVPLAVGAWSLTGSWGVALAVLYPKILFSLVRIMDALKGRTEPVNVSLLTEPEDFEISPITQLVRWANSRRRIPVGPQMITMDTQRARSQRSRGR